MLEELVRLNVTRLEEEFRSRERGVEVRVGLPLALRLDGVSFGQALRGFAEPRDERVHEALVEGASELVRRLSASGAFVTSDEVNVLLLGPSLPYGGRVEKLVSVSASLLSATVSLALDRPLAFDCRVVPLKGVDDAKLYVAYRARVGLNNYVGSTLKKMGVRAAERVKMEQQIAELEGAGRSLRETPVWEWGGTGIYWRVVGGRRELGRGNGPWQLIEELERYRAPELQKG